MASSVLPRSSLRVLCAAVVTLAVTMVLVGPAQPSEGQTAPNCGLNAVTVDGTAAVLAGGTYTGSVSADSFTVNVSFTDSEDRYVYVNLHTGIQREYLGKLDNSGSFSFDIAAYTAKLQGIPLWLQIRKGGDNEYVKHYNHVNQTVRYMSKTDWYAKERGKSFSTRAATAAEITEGQAAVARATKARASLSIAFPVTFSINVSNNQWVASLAAQWIDNNGDSRRCPYLVTQYVTVRDARTAVIDVQPLEPNEFVGEPLKQQPQQQQPQTKSPTTTTAPTTTTTPTTTTAAPHPTYYPPQQSDTTKQAEPADDEEETGDDGVTLTDVLQAAKAYNEGNLSREELQKIIRAYLTD